MEHGIEILEETVVEIWVVWFFSVVVSSRARKELDSPMRHIESQIFPFRGLNYREMEDLYKVEGVVSWNTK